MAGVTTHRSLTQYAAVARMRMQVMGHSVRTGRGQFDMAAQLASWASYLVLGTLFAGSFGAGAYYTVRGPQMTYFALVLWGALSMWQLTPIMAISFREEHDLSGLARYPIGFGAYYILFLFFGFFDLSTIFGFAALLGIAAGIGLARPELLPAALPGLALFAAFNILLNRAIFAWISRWLAKRRSREMLGVFFLLFVIAMEFINPALHHINGHIPIRLLLALKTLLPLNALLPPGLICSSMQGILTPHLASVFASLAGMAAWTALPAVILAGRLHSQSRGESLSEAPARAAALPRRKAETHSSWLDVTGPVAAIMVKEARYLMRSYQLLYGLVAPLILMLVFTGTPEHHNAGALVTPLRFLFPIAVFYAFLGLTRLNFNSLGAEGSGLQFYFVSPVPFWKVMLGKNLFHCMLLTVEVVVLWIIAVLRAGPPSASELLLTLCAITFIVPANFLAANLIALHMPYRMNFSRLGRPQGATANNLLSLLSQLVILGLCALAYFTAITFGGPWAATVVLLLMGVAAGATYWFLLKGLGQRAQRRMDVLLNDLARPTG
jgi:ABC-2 type transport system permease protein